MWWLHGPARTPVRFHDEFFLLFADLRINPRAATGFLPRQHLQ